MRHPRIYHVTTKHSASSYGMPVIVDKKGKVYGVFDTPPAQANDPLAWLKEENFGHLISHFLVYPNEIGPAYRFTGEKRLLRKLVDQWREQTLFT